MLNFADEFPCASFIEGGDGIDNDSPGTIVCAPQSVKCVSTAGTLKGILDRLLNFLEASTGKDSNRSEQDWQAASIVALQASLFISGGKLTCLKCCYYRTP